MGEEEGEKEWEGSWGCKRELSEQQIHINMQRRFNFRHKVLNTTDQTTCTHVHCT